MTKREDMTVNNNGKKKETFKEDQNAGLKIGNS